MSTNLNTAKNKYQWIKAEERYPGAPSYVVGLPKGEGFSPLKILVFNFTALKALVGLLIAQFFHLLSFLVKKISQGKLIFQGTADLGLANLFSTFNDWENLQNFDSFFKFWTFLPKPGVANTWNQDTEFGRQRLVGLNPVLIRKCQPEDLSTNSKFHVSDELLQSYLGDNFTLAEAFASNRLYLLDYKILHEIITPQQQDQLGRYGVAPLCLLYVNDQKQLIPIAIQLQQKDEGENSNPIFTPSSSPQEWLTAKLAVSATDAAHQGIVTHLLETHLVAEIFAVSTYRTLSPQHILYQILKPHFFNTLAINTMARNAFLGRSGFFDSTGSLGYTSSNELLSRGYYGDGINICYQGKAWEFYKTALPYNLKQRDVYNLPNYYYRDDALLIWNSIKEYVTNVLKIQYQDAESLEKDVELQSWKNELIAFEGGNIKGLLPPQKSEQLTGKLNNLDDLVEIVTNIIFTATALHAAVNFSQYEYAAWILNMPFATYQSFEYRLLHDKKHQPELLKYLPNRIQAIKQIILVKTLTLGPPYTSKSLLTLKNPFKTELEKQAFKNFQKSLKDIENQIKARNTSLVKSGQKPYIYLLPSRIPQSIAI
jgi:hypothetical protein